MGAGMWPGLEQNTWLEVEINNREWWIGFWGVWLQMFAGMKGSLGDGDS